MEKNFLLTIIFESVCGLVCIGLGVYYIFCGKATQAAVFIVVGAGCVVMAVRTFLKMRKEKKNKEKEQNEDNK